MTNLEQTIREVSDLRDFFLRMEPVRQAARREEARRAQVVTKESPKKPPLAKSAAARPNEPHSIRTVDPLIRKVSDLRDLCNQVANLNPVHSHELAARSTYPTGPRRPRESNKIPPAPIIRRHRPGK